MTRIIKAALLLFFFSLCGAAFFVSHQVRERVATPLPRELFAVVNDQLTALRAADYVSAYRHAAMGVQQKFTLPQFERMARHSYGAIDRHRIEFGSAKVDGSAASVHVFFISPDGVVRSFLYSLAAENKLWKISGVQELSVPSTKAPLAGLHV